MGQLTQCSFASASRLLSYRILQELFGDARQVLVNGRLEYTKKASPVSLWRAIFHRCRRQKDCAGFLEDTGRFCVDACVHVSSPLVMS